MANNTISAIAGAAVEEAKKMFGPSHGPTISAEQGVVGLNWLRSLLGRSEWEIARLGVRIRL